MCCTCNISLKLALLTSVTAVTLHVSNDRNSDTGFNFKFMEHFTSYLSQRACPFYYCHYISDFYIAFTERRNWSPVYATAYRLSIRPSQCVKTRECRRMRSSLLGRSVSSFLMSRMVDGGRPCPGKIWVQRGRPLLKQLSCTHFASPEP